uniref:Putative ring finger protein transmembrane 2 n=1 Tax=Ixodes ricinus TaxID=34613 RepID=V5ID73_IXORI
MEVVWIVVVTDFVLKLITILVKALIVALPGFLSCFPRRGKYYLFVETSSQVYRSVVPMQHWLYYFSESYTGSTKIFSMMLSGAYLLCKCSDIVAKTKAWKKSLIQVLSNVNYGRTPTADQTKAAGESCAICQDEFKRPTVLACNHIFCEGCVSVWFDRERTCPMCRAQIADDPRLEGRGHLAARPSLLTPSPQPSTDRGGLRASAAGPPLLLHGASSPRATARPGVRVHTCRMCDSSPSRRLQGHRPK